MYGLTSEPQFLHATLRSTSATPQKIARPRGRARPLGFPAPLGLCAGAALAGRRLDNSADQRAEIAARPPFVELALGAGSVLDQVGDALELALAPHFARVWMQPLDEPASQLASGDARAFRQVDQLALEAVARRQPLVLLQQLVRERAELVAGLVVLGELLGHRLDQRRDRDGVLQAGLRVTAPHLDRAELRVGPDVPPQERVVGDRARLHHEVDAPLVVTPAVEPLRHPDPG